MKKFVLLFICLFSFSYPVFADEAAPDNSNWGIQPITADQQKAKETSASEKTWNQEVNETIYDNYGSDESPAFLNRENIDPHESDLDEDYDSGSN